MVDYFKLRAVETDEVVNWNEKLLVITEASAWNIVVCINRRQNFTLEPVCRNRLLHFSKQISMVLHTNIPLQGWTVAEVALAINSFIS